MHFPLATLKDLKKKEGKKRKQALKGAVWLTTQLSKCRIQRANVGFWPATYLHEMLNQSLHHQLLIANFCLSASLKHSPALLLSPFH